MNTTPIVPSNTFSTVYQIDNSDRVLGGELGAINIQAKQLADRDAHLDARITAMNPMRYSGATIYMGVIPAQGSDAVIDLSSYIGVAKRAWVHIRVLGGNGAISAQIKENGTPTMYANYTLNKGTSHGFAGAGQQYEVSCITDATGKIQVSWNYDCAGGTTSSLVLLCYQILG